MQLLSKLGRRVLLGMLAVLLLLYLTAMGVLAYITSPHLKFVLSWYLLFLGTFWVPIIYTFVTTTFRLSLFTAEVIGLWIGHAIFVMFLWNEYLVDSGISQRLMETADLLSGEPPQLPNTLQSLLITVLHSSFILAALTTDLAIALCSVLLLLALLFVSWRRVWRGLPIQPEKAADAERGEKQGGNPDSNAQVCLVQHTFKHMQADRSSACQD